MVKSKLVYTTDKNNPAYVDNIGGMSEVDGIFAKEANIERRQSINQMNKSKRRHMVIPKGKEMKKKEINPVKEKEFTWIINYLYLHKKAFRKTLLSLLPNRNAKYIDNTMQTIKCAVEPYVFSKDGLWQIKEDCPMDANSLIELAVKNRNARFKRPKKDKAPKEKLPKTKRQHDINLKSQKIVVDSGAPVEIEIKTGKASIVIKIG